MTDEMLPPGAAFVAGAAAESAGGLRGSGRRWKRRGVDLSHQWTGALAGKAAIWGCARPHV